MDSCKILLHLSLCKGIGPALAMKIVKALGPDRLHELYLDSSDLVEQRICSHPQLQLIRDALRRDEDLFKRELQLLEQHDITWISYYSDDYPQLLREIHVPPLGLYVLGSVTSLKQQSVAIVGSRDAQRYAQDVVHRLIPPLVAHGIAIVSGGAIGVDAMAHKETLAVGGTTIAVLGSGLMNLYPVSNKKIFHEILATGGAIISTFPLQEPAMPHNFPIRNRIIAGISRGTVVVQAAQKSGAKITAQFALEQGRDVFAVPGPITDPLSFGCHELLREGAILVADAQHILDEFGYLEQTSFLDHVVSEKSKPVGLQDNFLVWCAVPISFDDLLQKSAYKEHELYDKLFQLQCDGLVEQAPSGLWQKI